MPAATEMYLQPWKVPAPKPQLATLGPASQRHAACCCCPISLLNMPLACGPGTSVLCVCPRETKTRVFSNMRARSSWQLCLKEAQARNIQNDRCSPIRRHSEQFRCPENALVSVCSSRSPPPPGKPWPHHSPGFCLFRKVSQWGPHRTQPFRLLSVTYHMHVRFLRVFMAG